MRKNSSDEFSDFLSFLPKGIAEAVNNMDAEALFGLTEVRLRRGRAVSLCFGGEIRLLCDEKGGLRLLSDEEMEEAWRRITSSSLYALEEEIRGGYVTVGGGHRVGIAGTAVLREGSVSTQKDILSLNYRFCRDLRGVGRELLPFLFEDGVLQNTLIFSPPAAGKTTLLRDLTRLLSEGAGGRSRINVTVVDERGEIAAAHGGRCRFDLGDGVDVLTGFPKYEGMLLALRSLSPSLLVSDEIGQAEDRMAVAEAIRGGVKLLLTAHASSLEELRGRPILRELLGDGVFGRLLLLAADPRPGTVKAAYRAVGKEGNTAYVPMVYGFAADPLRRGGGVDLEKRSEAAGEGTG